MWDAQSGQSVMDLLKGHGGWVTSVAFSTDGTLSLDLVTRQSECGMLSQARVSWIL